MEAHKLLREPPYLSYSGATALRIERPFAIRIGDPLVWNGTDASGIVAAVGRADIMLIF
jgi:S1-C subfamily serine protease